MIIRKPSRFPSRLAISLFVLCVTMFVYVYFSFSSATAWIAVAAGGCDIGHPIAQQLQSFHQSMNKQRNGGDASRQLSRREAAWIVNQTYNNVFTHFTSSCPMELAIKRCLSRAFQSNKTNVPWWFQTMLRDARANPLNGFHYQTAHNVTRDGQGLRSCVLEKVGTKQWRQMYCRFQGRNVKHPIHCESDPPVPEDVPRAVFLRDPLERFLSAYIDKCLHPKPGAPHCDPREIFLNKNSTLTDGLETDKKLMFEAYVDSMPLQWNIHFFPQSFYCDGLYRHIDSYDFRGMMGEHFYHDLDRMGQQFGGRLVDGLERVFDLQRVLNESKKNVGVEQAASTKVFEYYTPKSLRRVLEYMSIDYVLFDLPIPDWVDAILEQDSTIMPD